MRTPMFRVGDEVMAPASCWNVPALISQGAVFLAKITQVAGDHALVATLGGQYQPIWLSQAVLTRAFPVYDHPNARSNMPRLRDRH